MLKMYLYWSIVLDKHHLGCNLRLNSFSSFEGKLFRYVRRAFFTIMEMDMGSSYEPKTIILWNHFRLSKKIIYLNILQQHIFLRIPYFGGWGGGGGGIFPPNGTLFGRTYDSDKCIFYQKEIVKFVACKSFC